MTRIATKSSTSPGAGISILRPHGHSTTRLFSTFDSPASATHYSILRQHSPPIREAHGDPGLQGSLESQKTPHFSALMEVWNGRRGSHVGEGGSVMVPARFPEIALAPFQPSAPWLGTPTNMALLPCF